MTFRCLREKQLVFFFSMATHSKFFSVNWIQ